MNYNKKHKYHITYKKLYDEGLYCLATKRRITHNAKYMKYLLRKTKKHKKIKLTEKRGNCYEKNKSFRN